ncbi:GntR family transcriptional regulator [Antarctobacter sp.]|uniref:GntR family transcriptional regulator n=1 Tax=Antarctobacter sp. TaxID=1872577 RepID=UPI003A9352FC
MDTKTFFEDSGNESIAEKGLRRIRSDIIRNDLAPGSRLRLERLRETYGTSVTTLREILSRLVVEGFVEAQGNRGFSVVGVSEADLRDICEMRLLLECNALRRSIAAGTLAWEAHVVASHHKLRTIETQLIAGDRDRSLVSQWVQYDWDFHHATVMACDMPVLKVTHSNMFDRYLRYHLLALDFRGRPAAQEHERLRDLVVSRQTDAAIDLLNAHVHAGMEHILSTGKIPV